MKLIIIGNGFDLHHGYRTSFNHFRQYLLDSTNNDDRILVEQIDKLVGLGAGNTDVELLWNDYETRIGQIMSTENYKKHVIKNIPTLMENFSEKFYSYLIETTKDKLTKINGKIERDFENAQAILTFNYTSTYTKYLKDTNQEVFHIHGELSDNNLPIIGYHYGNILKGNSTDYLIRYQGKEIHKPALAYKQNEIDFEGQLSRFINKWKSKISEIIIIGYSFGKSDQHIYGIIENLLISNKPSEFVPASKAGSIQSIKFKIYNYNSQESDKIVERIKSDLKSNRRVLSVKITGSGYSPQEKEIITFELTDYD